MRYSSSGAITGYSAEGRGSAEGVCAAAARAGERGDSGAHAVASTNVAARRQVWLMGAVLR
jgi:hypothetical protein